MTSMITPTILCGGMGSRLWPKSREEQPKQFQSIMGRGGPTFFQSTVARHRGAAFTDPIVVTNAAQTAIVQRQMRELSMSGRVIGEPVRRNTGPAVLAAALTALRDDPNALILVLPSDHIIAGDINTPIAAMADAAAQGRIVTFGVVPSYAETGYGYILDGGHVATYPGLHNVDRFIEKPDHDRAAKLIESGASYWASGISLFSAAALVAEFGHHAPQTLGAVERALARATHDDTGASVLDGCGFAGAENEPTERLIFERSASIALAPLKGVQWDDVGAWNAVHQISPAGPDGNVTIGDVVAQDTSDSLIISEDRLVATIGLRDIVVVDTPDAVLVAHRSASQDVKKMVEALQRGHRGEVVSHRLRDMSWGQIETLRRSAECCEMHILTIDPGAAFELGGENGAILMVMSGEIDCRTGCGLRQVDATQSIARLPTEKIHISNMQARPARVLLLDLTPEAGKAAGLDLPAPLIDYEVDLHPAVIAAQQRAKMTETASPRETG